MIATRAFAGSVDWMTSAPPRAGSESPSTNRFASPIQDSRSSLTFRPVAVSNWLIAWQSLYVWTLITLLVSLLHYGYDGIIWRAKPATAK